MKTTIFFIIGVLLLLTSQVFSQGETSSAKGDELSKGISKEETSAKNNPGWGVAIKASTFGPGIEIVKAFKIPVNLRLGGTWLNYSMDISQYTSGSEDVKSINNLHFGTVSLMADWQFADFMHLTGGVLYNFTEEVIDVYSNDVVYVGEVEVTPETMGYTSAKIYTSKINPYLGIGFGRSISKQKVVGFGVDLGVAYIGSPKVDLMANGMLEPTADAIITADGTVYNKEIIENNIENYKFYPVISFQLSFRITGNK